MLTKFTNFWQQKVLTDFENIEKKTVQYALENSLHALKIIFRLGPDIESLKETIFIVLYEKLLKNYLKTE